MDAPQDPIRRFLAWQREAADEQARAGWSRDELRRVGARWLRRALTWALGEPIPHVDAAALATAGEDGAPAVRMVLVKETSLEGFVFYTNYRSRKAGELAANPRAELCFYWPAPPRQVRVTGPVEVLEPTSSDRYWRTRPRGSQLSAAASRQSAELGARQELVARVVELRRTFAGREVPRPELWGGYRLIPRRLEFWQGRPDRLHEREAFDRDAAAPGGWRATLLYP